VSLSIGSLFSGVGGLEKGLEMAGFGPVVFQVERDPFCRRVLARHWPATTRYDDVSQPRAYPAVDVIAGGFPCQDVSQASRGRGAGLTGERSGLWFYFASIVAKVAPRFVIVENVAGSAVPQWLPTVRRHLCGLGYRTRALEVRAADVGAPHGRARVFVVGYADANRKPTRTVDAKTSRMPATASTMRDGWPAAPERLRMVDGLPDGLDRLRALGNAVVPQCAEVAGRVLLEWAAERAPAQEGGAR
jgi:DNA (cytosine-5)-methyltransferase 1